MGSIVSLADLKTMEAETSNEHDDQYNLAISRVERQFFTEIHQDLAQTTYTSEKYTGNGTVYLQLKHYPIISLTSVAIEDESAIDKTNDEVIRYETGPDAYQPGLLTLVGGRVWTVDKPYNITVTYVAGYSASTIAIKCGDVWNLLIDAASQLYHDVERRQKGVASQSHMSESVSYFTEGARDTNWYHSQWLPMVRKYERRGGTSHVAQKVF